jgi:NAD(P)-dependent dehydrogenase (short-subunit alcohol dehydrogenase family)
MTTDRVVKGQGVKGHVALVTGGSRGLGRVYVQKLAEAGAKVVILARGREQLDGTVDIVRSAGGDAEGMPMNVTDPVSVAAAFAEVQARHGRIDLLVNNAGNMGPLGSTWELDPELWWSTLEIHLLGSLLCFNEAMARMVKQGHGRIINLVSNGGAYRWPTASAYSVAKAALIKFTENVAVEAKGSGVSLFAFHPGLVLETGIAKDMLATAPPGSSPAAVSGLLDWFESQREKGQIADPQLGAEVLLRLASGQYDFLSGRYVSAFEDFPRLLDESEQVCRSNDAMMLRVRPAFVDAGRKTAGAAMPAMG